jgi:hypothetical protein
MRITTLHAVEWQSRNKSAYEALNKLKKKNSNNHFLKCNHRQCINQLTTYQYK